MSTLHRCDAPTYDDHGSLHTGKTRTGIYRKKKLSPPHVHFTRGNGNTFSLPTVCQFYKYLGTLMRDKIRYRHRHRYRVLDELLDFVWQTRNRRVVRGKRSWGWGGVEEDSSGTQHAPRHSGGFLLPPPCRGREDKKASFTRENTRSRYHTLRNVTTRYETREEKRI